MLEASEATVDRFEEILLIPLRVRPSGPLEEVRRSADVPLGILLDRYQRILTGRDSTACDDQDPSGWVVQDGYFQPHEELATRLGLSREKRYAEFVYFHPFIQKMLFAEGSQVRVLVRHDITGLAVKLDEETPAIRLRVPRIQMFLFPADVAVVAVQIRAEDRLPFNAVLRLLNTVRRIFPPYFDAGRPGQCPARLTWLHRDPATDCADWSSNFEAVQDFTRTALENRVQPMARHWRTLLVANRRHDTPPHAGGEDDQLTFEPFEDDRAPLMAFVPMSTGEELRRQDQVRLALLEEPSTSGLGYPYGQAFLTDFETRHCYDRFYDPPRFTTRYFLTSYNFTLLGHQGDSFFGEIVRGHFSQHYFAMVLIAQAQKASLLVFWDRLAEISRRYSAEEASEMSRTRLRADLKCLIGDFADFTGRMWFSEISNQVQPTELFEKYTEHLGTRRLYGEVKDQIGLMREVQLAADAEDHVQFEKQSAIVQTRFTQLQDRWFPLLLATGILGMDGAFANFPDWLLKHGFYIETGPWNKIPFEFPARLALLLALWYLFGCAVRLRPEFRLFGKKGEGERNNPPPEVINRQGR